MWETWTGPLLLGKMVLIDLLDLGLPENLQFVKTAVSGKHNKMRYLHYRKKERSKISDLIFHLKMTEKEQHDPKTHRREKIIKSRNPRNRLEMDGGDVWRATWMHLMPLNWALKNGYNSKFCYIGFTTIFKYKKIFKLFKEIHEIKNRKKTNKSEKWKWSRSVVPDS